MDIITAAFENDTLTLYAHKRIDAVTAPIAEVQILKCCAEYPTDNVVLDADDLDYISSAGLRVVLRLLKHKPDLRVINTSIDVYDIFEMTGFSEMMTVEKGYRKLSVEGCDVIGCGAKGTVYRYNADTVVKVYNKADSLPSIQKERELARRAFVLGIPTAIPYDIVRVGEKFGSVFELLDAKSYSRLICEEPENAERYIYDFSMLLRQIHETIVKPNDMPDGKLMVDKWLKSALPYLSDEDNAKLRVMVDALPDTLNMLHCDYHTNNIMMQNGETLLIDMDTLAHGHPVIDLANIYITFVGFLEFDPDDVEHFLGFSREMAKKVWTMFLPFYLGTDDPEILQAVERKAKLLSYVRCIHHTVRHLNDDIIIRRFTSICADKIHGLLGEVDSLDF